jgi:hypothetical protein
VRGGSRLAVLGMLLAAVVAAAALLVFVNGACAGDQPGRPCPEAGLNRTVVVALVGVVAALLVAPFAYLAEFAARRRIEYRGSWGRALRRGLLAGLVVAALAGLRVGEALSVPSVLFVLIMAALVEWSAVRRFDLP